MVNFIYAKSSCFYLVLAQVGVLFCQKLGVPELDIGTYLMKLGFALYILRIGDSIWSEQQTFEAILFR